MLAQPVKAKKTNEVVSEPGQSVRRQTNAPSKKMRGTLLVFNLADENPLSSAVGELKVSHGWYPPDRLPKSRFS